MKEDKDMVLKYDKVKTVCYWLAKHLGLASQYDNFNGLKLIIPNKIYPYAREQDDDRWFDYEKVCGTQIYPLDSNWLKYNEIEFGWDSLYRSYIRQRVWK